VFEAFVSQWWQFGCSLALHGGCHSRQAWKLQLPCDLHLQTSCQRQLVQLDGAAAALCRSLYSRQRYAINTTDCQRHQRTHSLTLLLPLPLVMCPPQSQSDPGRSAAVYEALKDDAELAPVFEDVKANGPAALQK
jgi:hypothetical protein